MVFKYIEKFIRKNSNEQARILSSQYQPRAFKFTANDVGRAWELRKWVLQHTPVTDKTLLQEETDWLHDNLVHTANMEALKRMAVVIIVFALYQWITTEEMRENYNFSD